MTVRKVNVNKIKRMRKQEHITLEEMAKRLGYSSPNGYYYLERGRSKFTAETLAAVADILDIPIEDLFFESARSL